MNIRTIDVNGFAPAIYAMRAPMQSWKKSDSLWTYEKSEEAVKEQFEIGQADKELSLKLQKAGPEHCKHLRMIQVWAEIEAPLFWWKQMDCYRAGVEKVSTSTMHTLLKKPFETADFEFNNMPGYHVIPAQFIPEPDLENEKWVEYEGYKVSNQGRILNKAGKEIKGVLHADGYRFVWFKGKITAYHRIIATCFCEGYKEGKVVDHIDGNKQNNKAENLEWVTQKENIRRSRENGLQPKQLKTNTGKLSSEEREHILELYNTEEYTVAEIARMFGVSHSAISAFISGRHKFKKPLPNLFNSLAVPAINELNRLREEYLNSEDQGYKKQIWESIVQILPEAFIQKRIIMFSYAALRNIVKQREGHKLNEWAKFIEWVHTLPYAELLIFDKGEELKEHA